MVHDFIKDNALWVKLTKDQHNALYAMKYRTDYETKNIVSAKSLSVKYGFGKSDTEIAVIDMFSPYVHLHPNRPHYNKSLSEQAVALVQMVAYAQSCACLAQTCTQSDDTGCPIYRDPEAMKIIARASQLTQKDDEFYLRFQLRSSSENPYSLEKAGHLFTRNSAFLETGEMCSDSANCHWSCTYSDPKSYNAEGKQPEGVLVPSFETMLKHFLRMTGIEQELFPPITKKNKGKIAVIGMGPGGANHANYYCVLVIRLMVMNINLLLVVQWQIWFPMIRKHRKILKITQRFVAIAQAEHYF